MAQGETNLPTKITTAPNHFQAALEEAKFSYKSFIWKFLRAGSDRILFSGMNGRLRAVFEDLLLLLQVDQQVHIASISQGTFWQQDQQDTEKDRQAFQKLKSDKGFSEGGGVQMEAF